MLRRPKALRFAICRSQFLTLPVPLLLFSFPWTTEKMRTHLNRRREPVSASLARSHGNEFRKAFDAVFLFASFSMFRRDCSHQKKYELFVLRSAATSRRRRALPLPSVHAKAKSMKDGAHGDGEELCRATGRGPSSLFSYSSTTFDLENSFNLDLDLLSSSSFLSPPPLSPPPAVPTPGSSRSRASSPSSAPSASEPTMSPTPSPRLSAPRP